MPVDIIPAIPNTILTYITIFSFHSFLVDSRNFTINGTFQNNFSHKIWCLPATTNQFTKNMGARYCEFRMTDERIRNQRNDQHDLNSGWKMSLHVKCLAFSENSLLNVVIVVKLCCRYTYAKWANGLRYPLRLSLHWNIDWKTEWKWNSVVIGFVTTKIEPQI